MSRVTVIGEALVDVVDESAHPGGSPLNVAVGLARLGHEVQFYSEFGQDEYGRQIAEHLSESRVHVAPGSVTRRATSIARVHLDEHSNAHYTFDIHQQIPQVIAREGTELFHTGSIAAWIEPSGQCIVDAFTNAPDGTILSYDPNLRPDLVKDRQSVIQRIELIISLSHIVKLSDVDAQWLYPELEPWEVLEHVGSLGAGLAVMTQGGDGCLAQAFGQRYDVAASPTTLKDTIGAGDAFMSGLLYGVLDNQELVQALRIPTPVQPRDVEETLHHALTSAAMTVAQTGANPPWLEEFAYAINN